MVRFDHHETSSLLRLFCSALVRDQRNSSSLRRRFRDPSTAPHGSSAPRRRAKRIARWSGAVRSTTCRRRSRRVAKSRTNEHATHRPSPHRPRPGAPADKADEEGRRRTSTAAVTLAFIAVHDVVKVDDANARSAAVNAATNDDDRGATLGRRSRPGGRGATTTTSEASGDSRCLTARRRR